MKSFIPAKEEVLIGGLTFLNDWIIRSETSNALDKLFVRNIKTEKEEELIFSDENVMFLAYLWFKETKTRMKYT